MAQRSSTLGAVGGGREVARRGEQRLGGEMDGEEEEEQRWVGEVGGGGRWRRSGSCAIRNGDVLLWIRDTQWAVHVAFFNQLYRLKAAGFRRAG